MIRRETVIKRLRDCGEDDLIFDPAAQQWTSLSRGLMGVSRIDIIGDMIVGTAPGAGVRWDIPPGVYITPSGEVVVMGCVGDQQMMIEVRYHGIVQEIILVPATTILHIIPAPAYTEYVRGWIDGVVGVYYPGWTMQAVRDNQTAS